MTSLMVGLLMFFQQGTFAGRCSPSLVSLCVFYQRNGFLEDEFFPSWYPVTLGTQDLFDRDWTFASHEYRLSVQLNACRLARNLPTA